MLSVSPVGVVGLPPMTRYRAEVDGVMLNVSASVPPSTVTVVIPPPLTDALIVSVLASALTSSASTVPKLVLKLV